MPNGTVFDIAAGLLIVFVILSVTCAWLNEAIQSVRDQRARMLQTAIEQLLGDEPLGPARRIKQHVLIRALAHDPSAMPSYLSSSAFAQALLDALVPADGEHPLTMRRLREAVAQLPDASRAALLALTNAPDADLAGVRANIERWFDDAMDRTSGAYKRHISRWLFGLGFVLAAATNLDTIQLVQRFERESSLRAAVAADIAHTAASGKLATRQPHAEDLAIFFWDTDHIVSVDQTDICPRALRSPELSFAWLAWLALKLVGFLMTGVAVSLFAPWLFDLLSRFVNLRATGTRPAKAGLR